MQMFSLSLFVVLIATSWWQRTQKEKSRVFLLGPSTAVRAPIGSYWLRFQLSAAAIG